MIINKRNIAFSIFFSFLMFLGVLTALICFFLYNYKIPLRRHEDKNIYYIVDSCGFCFQNKENNYCSLKELNEKTIGAFLSAEDANFFKHRGISLKGIIRSIIVNFKSGKFTQGASTITQQYIKLSSGDLKKTLIRKIKEQIKALLIETHYSKEEILQEYLNILYFGNGIFGIKNAAKLFWNCDLKDLSIAQSAALAGIIQSPERLNPFKDLNLCLKKRNLILKRMKINNYITEQGYSDALNEQLKLSPFYDLNEKNFISYMSENFIDDEFLFDKNNKKYFIQTTFDFELQKLCFIEFKKVINALKLKVPNLEGALILIDNSTREIKACINGFLPEKNKLRAIKNKRQIGSTIKPLVAYYAFLNGDEADSVYSDMPIEEFKYWNPRNNNRKFSGNMTIKQAIIESNNIVPIRILMKYGVDNFYGILKNTNLIQCPGPYYSLALGCCQSTVLEMVSIINAINNLGKIRLPFFISRIRDESNNLLFKNNIIEKDLFEASHMIKVYEVLKETAKRICNKLNKKYIEDLIAKTGTTNESRTCWFIGATKKYSLALYIGTDFEESLSKYKISSLRHAAEIGINILSKI